MRDFFSTSIKNNFSMIISISFSCKYTEKWYFFLFFNEKIGKNKEKYHFSVKLQLQIS